MFDEIRHKLTCKSEGFTLVELMVVVLIIGVLVSIAIPVFIGARAKAEQKTCFANQREIEGVIIVWQVDQEDNRLSLLAGPVNASNPLVALRFVRPPHCPSAPRPVNSDDPTVGEGAYTLDTSGTVIPCTWGTLGPHGSFH